MDWRSYLIPTGLGVLAGIFGGRYIRLNQTQGGLVGGALGAGAGYFWEQRQLEELEAQEQENAEAEVEAEVEAIVAETTTSSQRGPSASDLEAVAAGLGELGGHIATQIDPSADAAAIERRISQSLREIQGIIR